MSNVQAAASSPARDTASSPVAAPQANAWVAVFTIALTAAVFCTTEFLPVGILRYISAGLGVSEGTAGYMVTAPGLLAAIAAPFLTVAIKNLDRRFVLWVLSALLMVSNLVDMLAPNFAVLIAGRVLFGIGLGGFWAIGAGLGGRLVEAKFAARATSIIFAGVSIGMLIGGPAGALLGDLVGWRPAFGVSLLLSAFALVLQFIFLPPLHVKQSVAARDLLGIWRTANGKVGLIAMFLILSGQFATYTYVTPFLAQVSGFDGKAISSILLGYTAIGLLGNFAGGAGAGRNVKTTFLLTILFVLLPLLLLPTLGHSKVWAVALLAVWGLAYGAMPVALQVWMAKAATDVPEGGMALFVANFQISIALGSLAGGLIIDMSGIAGAMYFGAGIAALSALLLVALGKKPA
ncbi:MFS transporter [Rugamonas sp.]|uniref:MFS transporter n=1 Tax=Rugamonas sp. TaxID=1926287 RepID=UPI0025CCCF41|nr:MFS transporter [Rugamonas sp.]